MSRRLLLLEIDANAKTCGLCDWSRHGFVDDYCRKFKLYCRNDRRLPECLAAEKLAKGVKK